MEGKISSILSMGTVDGPGIRTVIFFQGCPLRCAYCHNPETHDFNAGTLMTANDVFKKILPNMRYFKGNGGVTLSGGEVLYQAEFATELLRLCKTRHIHTALDTSGCILNDDVKKLLEYTDLCLLDIKMTSEEDYKKYIGGSLKNALEFLEYLDSIKMPVWIRQVIVPDINDTKENYRTLLELIKPYKCVEKVELLPFRKLCLEKYETMGLSFPLKDTRECSPKDIERIITN